MTAENGTAGGGPIYSNLPQDKRSVKTDLEEFLGVKVPFSFCTPAVTENYFSEILLPGKGKKPKTCKGIWPKYFCSKCGMPHFAKGNCGTSSCPDCETSWRFARTQSILERIFSAKVQRNLRVRHFVVSLWPEELESVSDRSELNQYFKEVYEFAKSKGAEGGVVLFHPFRILPEVKSALWAEIRLGRMLVDGLKFGEYKLWRRLLAKPNWRKLVYFAPHFHIIAVCKRGSNFEEGKKSDKFLWKGIGELSDVHDLGKCAMYLLSHLGVFQGEHYNSIRWFGNLSSSCWSLKKANMKLRNGSTVREFTLDKVSEFMERREEKDGSFKCSNCGHSLLHIKFAPSYWEKESYPPENELMLKVAYGWWHGSIPPPEGYAEFSETEAYEFLEKKVADILADPIARMVEGSSCLKVVGAVEDLSESLYRHSEALEEHAEAMRDLSESLDFLDVKSK